MSTKRTPDLPAPKQSFFRPAALEYYSRGRQEVVLPTFISVRRFVVLWLALTLLTLCAVSIAMIPVPKMLFSQAMFLKTTSGVAPISAIVMIEPRDQVQLQVGQLVLLNDRAGQTQLHGRISQIEATLMGPFEIQQRFNVHHSALQFLEHSTAVALVEFESDTAQKLSTISTNRPWRSTIKVGSQPAIKLLALTNSLTGE